MFLNMRPNIHQHAPTKIAILRNATCDNYESSNVRIRQGDRSLRSVILCFGAQKCAENKRETEQAFILSPTRHESVHTAARFDFSAGHHEVRQNVITYRCYLRNFIGKANRFA